MPRESYDDEMARIAQTMRIREEIALRKAQEQVDLYELSDLSMAEELKLEYTPPVYRIDGLHVQGNFTTLTATYKCGKSTMMLNLVRSLVDGVPFLGKQVRPLSGNLGYLNLELGKDTFREWFSATGTQHMEKVYTQHLRGVPFPLWHPEFAKKVVAWLKRHEIEALILDPAAELLPGWPGSERGVENNNDLIATVCKTLLEVKEAGGVTDLFVVLHTGHNAKGGDDMHARGASFWGGKPDHLWYMWSKQLDPTDKDPTRHFRAEGRSPSFPTKLLSYDTNTRLYTPEDSLEAVQARGRAKAVALGLLKLGGQAGKAELRKATKGLSNEAFPAAVEAACELGYILVDRSSKVHIHTLNLEHPVVQALNAFENGEKL